MHTYQIESTPATSFDPLAPIISYRSLERDDLKQHEHNGSREFVPWSELPALLKRERAIGHKYKLGLVFADIRETTDPDPKIGTGRRARNDDVRCVYSLGLDFDGLTDEQVGRVLEAVARYRRVGWSTFSHLAGTKPGTSFRIVLRLAVPRSRDEWPGFWEAAMARLGLQDIVDKRCKNVARLYYATCPERAEATFAASVDMLSGDGDDFDVPGFVPSWLAAPKAENDVPSLNALGYAKSIERCPAGTEPIDHALHLAMTMPASVSGQSGHDAALRIARALRLGLELSDDDTRTIFRDVYNPRCVPPWSDREIEHKVAEAAKLEGAPYPRGALLPSTRRRLDSKILDKTLDAWSRSKGSRADDAEKFRRGLRGEPMCQTTEEIRGVVDRVVGRLAREFPDVDAADLVDKIRLSLEHPSTIGKVQSTADVVALIERCRGTSIALVSPSELENVRRILTEDPEYAHRFRLDLLANRPFDTRTETLVSDDSLNRIRLDISRRYSFDAKAKDLGGVLRDVAIDSPFHPVRDYLDSLPPWDGRAVDLCDYFNAERNALNEYSLRAQLVAAVARAYEPGCKVDVCLILEGDQGFKKSSAVSALCPKREWFADAELAWGSKDAAINLLGKWIYEIPEIDGFRGKEPQTVKAFLSRATDRYRAPYGIAADDHVRTTVFFGSTNAADYLQDKTGERRYRPVRIIGIVDAARIARDRDRIWAEAVALHRQGFAFWDVPDDLVGELAAAHQARAEADSVQERLEAWLVGKERDGVAFSDACEASRLSGSRRDDGRVSRALTALGWKKRGNVGERKLKRWFPKSA